jgi:hypothetical protein
MQPDPLTYAMLVPHWRVHPDLDLHRPRPRRYRTVRTSRPAWHLRLRRWSLRRWARLQVGEAS